MSRFVLKLAAATLLTSVLAACATPVANPVPVPPPDHGIVRKG
jgi:hypothetical protein